MSMPEVQELIMLRALYTLASIVWSNDKQPQASELLQNLCRAKRANLSLCVPQLVSTHTPPILTARFARRDKQVTAPETNT